jgi:bifunctional NMN adenylyltransferase/nudix hydrolase
VLLVRRGANPGKGLLALPGGFININETVKESMFRELHEETKIKISDRELDAHLCYEKVFDHPDRSLRGRTVTHAGLISLPSSQFTKLPAIKGSDDAADAIWFPIGQLEDIQSQMYEDHFSIVTHMINRTR